MRQITDINELKQIELNILKEVASFCEKNNLRYFLAYGTLIGAIRHNGFIPWDDDIDIQMPREDYNKFIETFKHDYLIALNPYDKKSIFSYLKVIDNRTIKKEKYINDDVNLLNGIDVDIFPIDGAPDTETEYNKWTKKLYYTYRKHFFCIANFRNASIKLKMFLLSHKYFFNIKKKNKYLNKAAVFHKQYEYKKCENCTVIESSWNSPKNWTKKENFSDYLMHDFEGEKFRIPIGYDEILTNIYGDYMKLPPLEQQKTHHINNTFWKE